MAVAEQAKECSAQCGAEETPEAGAALLQISTGTGSLTKRAAVGATSSADDQLAEYTKLKESLAQDEESASIMRKIDDALDWRPTPDATASQKAGQNAATVGDEVRKASVAAKPALSLVETGSATSGARHTPSSSQESDAADLDEVIEDEEADDGEEAAEAEEADAIEGEDEEEQVDEEEEEEEDDTIPAKRKRHSSLLSTSDLVDVERLPLNEDGYLSVAESGSNHEMERFVQRLAGEMSLTIIDVGGLKGMVPFYSGQKSTQSFEALQSELLSTSRMDDGWLKRRKASFISTGSVSSVTRKRHRKKLKAKKAKPLLLQTQQTQHDMRRPAPLSLLHSTTHAVRKVVDMTTAMLGSGTIILICTMGLVCCLFSLDERKRTGGKGKDLEYDNPLNLSPEPPPIKGGKSDLFVPTPS